MMGRSDVSQVREAVQDPTSAVRSKENTRSKLVESSVQVFIDFGVDGATVDALTSAAGFTRGAFYSSFRSKVDVFIEAFELVTDRVIADLAGHLAKPDLHENPSAGYLPVLKALRPNAIPWYLLHSEAVSYALRDPSFARHVTVQRRRLRTAVADAFRAAEARGEASLTLDPTLLAETLLGVFMNLMLSEQLDGASDVETTNRVIEAILDTFVDPL